RSRPGPKKMSSTSRTRRFGASHDRLKASIPTCLSCSSTPTAATPRIARSSLCSTPTRNSSPCVRDNRSSRGWQERAPKKHGAPVTMARCDAADRQALESLMASISSAYPLTAVVHAAGTLDDGLLGAMTPERVDRVFAPKVDAAWHLHELTQHRDLAGFVLFS